jgi:hypothetical protein
MVPLLNACVEKLKLQQMKKMFIDAVPNNVEDFKHLGTSIWKACLCTTNVLRTQDLRSGLAIEMSGATYEATIL